MNQQTTIREEFTVKGRGLHSGAQVAVRVRPGGAGAGIIFRRIDIAGSEPIPAAAMNVADTSRGTTIAQGECRIATIEHLMSAMHGKGIDNAIIEVDGCEVPILDGSARLWVDAIEGAGILPLKERRRTLRISKPVNLTLDAATLTAEPDDHFSVDTTIDFPGTPIGRQQASLQSLNDFAKEVAPCRTFVLLRDIEPLLSRNLIKGGDLDNALVFMDKSADSEAIARLAALFHKDVSSIVGKEFLGGPRLFANEPARHKMLDFIGDIALAGLDIKAHFTIHCPGHKANTAFAAMIAKELICE